MVEATRCFFFIKAIEKNQQVSWLCNEVSKWAVFALLLLSQCMVNPFITAPAHPHATRVAVYLALLVMNSKEKSPKVSNDLLKETAIE